MGTPRYRERKDPSPAARMVRMILTLCARGMTRAEIEEEFQIDRCSITESITSSAKGEDHPSCAELS
jgi:uncharacterized protein (DUF433 family)